jgi:hypothetical protein
VSFLITCALIGPKTVRNPRIVASLACARAWTCAHILLIRGKDCFKSIVPSLLGVWDFPSGDGRRERALQVQAGELRKWNTSERDESGAVTHARLMMGVYNP